MLFFTEASSDSRKLQTRHERRAVEYLYRGHARGNEKLAARNSCATTAARSTLQPAAQPAAPGNCYSGPPISARTFEGSFSAVWVATIATKYSFCSVFRDLQDLHSFAPLRIQKIRKLLSNFLRFLLQILENFICYF